MSDNDRDKRNDDDRRPSGDSGRSSGSASRGGRSGSRDGRAGESSRQDRPRREGDRPYLPRQDRPSSGDRSTRSDDRSGSGDRPYRPRQDGPASGDRAYRPRQDRPASGDRPYRPREDRPGSGDRPYRPRDDRPGSGDRPYRGRDDRPARSGGDRSGSGDRPYRPRQDRPASGDRPYRPREDRAGSGDRPYRPREGGYRGGDARGSRPPQNADVRSAKSNDPEIPEEITARDLHPSARNELKTLSKENAESVARHLAMAARSIDDDPERAHAHALAASRRAGRIAVVRETVAITAYALGDYALALRELRTYRRISGRDDQIALMVDSERGVGRPDRAVEVGRAVDRAELPTHARVELAIALSGARLDLGEPERALSELDIPELDPEHAFEWSPALFQARATVLEELGRADEAAEWHRRAVIAADALDEAAGGTDEEIIVVEEFDDPDDHTLDVSDDETLDESLSPDADGALSTPVSDDVATDEPGTDETNSSETNQRDDA